MAAGEHGMFTTSDRDVRWSESEEEENTDVVVLSPAVSL